MDIHALFERLPPLIRDGWNATAWQPFDANTRLYIGYLLSAVLIASLVYLARPISQGSLSGRGWLRYLFSPSIWWHPSARLDYKLVLINPLIQMALKSLGGVSVVGVALWMNAILDNNVTEPTVPLPPWAVTCLFTLTLFIADDFSRYLLHRLLHRVPCLWALHKLHHSAEVLTPISVYRIHPLESLLYGSRMALTQGLVLGLFFFGFGTSLSAWDIVGANLFTFLFNLAGANLRHSHVWLSYGPSLERILISPAQHQIHHSAQVEHFDRNFGSCFALWDWLFGSLTIAKGQEIRAFGLGPGQKNVYPTLWLAYSRPVADALTSLGRTASSARQYPNRLWHQASHRLRVVMPKLAARRTSHLGKRHAKNMH